MVTGGEFQSNNLHVAWNKDALFMPALHSECRVDAAKLKEFDRVAFEHLDESHPPVPFNPVALRIAKLLADSKTILK